MGGDETYFFSPAAQPFNPNLTAAQQRAYELIGRANGGRLQMGWASPIFLPA